MFARKDSIASARAGTDALTLVEEGHFIRAVVQHVADDVLGHGPVSYTHLDVYKRQNRPSALHHPEKITKTRALWSVFG